MRMCKAEIQKGQQKVQILKKTTVLCPSRSYYSMTEHCAVTIFYTVLANVSLINKQTKFVKSLWILLNICLSSPLIDTKFCQYAFLP